ncbi:MAG: nucleoside triphosphate pyrophosphohydrolase [Eubacterium sp.]
MKHEYNKLVRDKIPEIIRESGRQCDYKILGNSEMLDALKEKLIEKANIFSERPSEDEVSDIYELLSVIVEKFDFEPMHIDYLKLQNKESKGTYAGNTFLIDVDDQVE